MCSVAVLATSRSNKQRRLFWILATCPDRVKVQNIWDLLKDAGKVEQFNRSQTN